MATRVLTTGRTLTTAWDRLVHLLATWSPAASFSALREFFWPAHNSVWECIVRLTWMPLWLGADLSAPRFHPRFRPTVGIGPASGRLVSLVSGVRRRQIVIRFVTLLARALTLTLIVATAWAAWSAVGGPKVSGDALLAVGLGFILTSLIFAWRHRPDVRDTARMLDRSFNLSDRMTTAIDHIAADPDRSAGHPHLAYLQIAEATNTVAILSRHSSLRVRFPVRELVLITGLALLFLSLYLLRGTGTGLPGSGNSAVPAFVSAKDRLQQQSVPNTPEPAPQDPPTVAEVQARADESASAEQDLLTLADALDDNPLTSPIADSIRAGDYDRAAAQMDAVASQVSQLSPETRSELADELDRAADAMTGEHPGLQDATGKAADGLRSDPQQAESSLTELGEQISETGESVETQGELASDMRDARQAESQGSSGQDTRPEPGEPQSDGAPGEQQIAGDGGDAASGQSGQPEQGEQSAGSGSSDSDEQSQSSGDGQQGDNGGPSATNQQEGSSGQSNGAGSGAESDETNGEGSGQGSGNVQGENQSEQGNSGGSSNDAQTGSGAGAGSGTSGEDQTSNGADERPGTGSTGSPDPDIEEGTGSGSNGPEAESGQPHSSITLSRSPDEAGMQTGGASSSSSGSGSGAAAGAGSVSQGDVGMAGPDSNRVPEQYRPIVEDYFSDQP
jgi:hypothetical protein